MLKLVLLKELEVSPQEGLVGPPHGIREDQFVYIPAPALLLDEDAVALASASCHN